MHSLLPIVNVAWRNVWRNTRRTVLTVGTVSLGLALLLISLGIGDGAHYQMIESAVRMGSGHVVIQTKGYQESGGVEKLLSALEQQEVVGWLAEQRGRFPIRHVLERTFASGLAASSQDASGVLMVGLDPELETRADVFFGKMVEGAAPDGPDSDRAVLGSGVARKLDVKLGEKVVLTAQGARGAEIQSALVRLGGVLRTGVEDIDQVTVLLPLHTARHFLQTGDGVHQVAVLLESSFPAEELARLGKERFPELEVLSWAEALPELRDFIRIDDAGNYVFHTVIFVLIAFMILNTLLMSVLERNREFALLEALGLTPVRRFAMVMVEGLVIAVLSSAGGVALGYGLHYYFATSGLPMDVFYSGEFSAAGVTLDPVIYSYLSAGRISGSILMVFVLTLLLALIPARRAARAADVQVLGRL